jgi:putative hydrolase of the HAD superfamily/pyrimidine and pyridine-specific 5'-nucleotidase
MIMKYIALDLLRDLLVLTAAAVISIHLQRRQEESTKRVISRNLRIIELEKTNGESTITSREVIVTHSEVKSSIARPTLISTQTLQDGTSLNNEERVCTVTPDNKPISGGHTRREMRLQNLWHRATYVVIRNDDIDRSEYILVQKRSKLKDYCPGRLDPTPGGVVGYGESFRENAVRELAEEMGIFATEQNLHRLFSFPYQDSHVKVWGDLYEVFYNGEVEDLVLQKEEVDDVIRMKLQDVQTSMKHAPDLWMPDALHAMRLYFQHRQDLKLNRRFFRQYSSDVDVYQVRPKPQVVFFDCDDCLYFDGWKVAQMLTDKIDQWCVDKGLKQGQAYQLYKQYGTALKGLLHEGYIDGSEESIDGFLQEVHDIPVMDHLNEDNHLRNLLLTMNPSIPKYIFTASVRDHADRCLKALGIDDLFAGIIDVKSCNLETKHNPKSFEAAMKVAGVTNPEACILLDDNVRNIKAAHEAGWRSILVGRVHRDTGQLISADGAESEIDVIHDFPKVLPELFEHHDGDGDNQSRYNTDQNNMTSASVPELFEQLN